MKNLLALIGLVVVGFAFVGWYAGWYTIGTEPGNDGHRKINVDVNTKEIRQDVSTFKEKVGDLISKDNKGTSTTPTIETKSDSQSPGVRFGPNGSPVIVLPKLEIKTGN